jgi:hypothetical protein
LSHATLLDKLPQYGIQGTELEWFKDYLFCRKQVVSYNGFLSADHNVSTGVPQGSILGPLLFLVYFNDVIEAIEHSSIVKYADTVLYVARKDIQSIQAKLSKDMDSLADWLRENELIINLKRGKQNLFYLELRKGLQNIVNLLKYRYHVHHPLLSQQQRYTNTWEY